METIIFIGIAFLLSLGAMQVDHRIQEERERKEHQVIINEMKWAPCPKINGIIVCEKQRDI